MKRWLHSLVLAGALLAAAGCAAPGLPAEAPAEAPSAAVEQIPAEWVPSLAEVATIHLSPGQPVPLEEAPQPLYATHPRHRESIAFLLDRLSEARLAPGEISPPSRAPALQIALKEGQAVSARLAYDCTPFTSETGHGYICRQAPGELILHTRQGREVRIANPRMALWLMSGWREDIPVGPAQDIPKETALEIARNLDAKAPWQATFYKEYPVESKGDTQVRRAWLLEAEYPSGSKTRLVIDAHTGEVLRIGHLESLE